MQPSRLRAVAALTAGLTLAACAAGLPAADIAGTGGTSPSAGLGQRDLGADEKKVIVDAVVPSIKDAGSAKYHWTKLPALALQDSVNYCATVDANSPYPPYDGRQAYIVKLRLSGGKVVGATMGLIAGGKDVALVAKMCARYGLDPNNAS